MITKKQREEILIVDIEPLRLTKSQKIYLPVKRFLDILLSFFALVILMPLFLVVAVAIKLDTPGPVFFVQIRVGEGASGFKMYKFRSMVIDADDQKDSLLNRNEVGGPFFKIKDDPRITKVGRFIRKYSIDELPQFANVLLGNMSLVGPRPALFREIMLYTPEQRNILAMKPGLTCHWQISGRSTCSGLRLEQDEKYITEFSLVTDLILLLKTPAAIFKGEGAY